ncbi:TRAP transporter small permease [Rhodovulum kholense]|uniref:TRAP transporter small permease protein n=1 Tax=Rhodovulum kholense TaxID=453584 RepID=A0A8E3AQK4_9RHOB|nr:TRAP transporter small permease [Rhodovulum kholense]PTW45630.1 TRAP-type C4-dicarboxylate transport system permease small subunit [Rhodovulum kholense]
MLSLLGRIERAIGAVLAPVIAAGMAALIAVITLQIVSRVAFTAVGWTEEVARFLLIGLTFLGAALAWQRHRHIAVGVLVERLPDGARRAATALALVIAVAFLISLVWVGQTYMMMQSFQKSAALRLPMSYVYAIIPVSAGLMAWLAATDLMRLVLTGTLPDAGEPVE